MDFFIPAKKTLVKFSAVKEIRSVKNNIYFHCLNDESRIDVKYDTEDAAHEAFKKIADYINDMILK